MKYLLAFLAFIGIAHAETASQYWVHMNPQKQAAILVWQDTKQWVSEWIGFGDGDVLWRDPNTGTGSSTEHFSLRDGWLVLNGFDQWPADCVKAELIDINSGQSIAITCGKGHFYAPFLLPRDPWRMKIWGLIANSVRFYWQADFFPDSGTDACYFSGPINAEVIREREVWWDSNGGWARGTGTKLPWALDGVSTWKPTDTDAVEQSETTIAKGYGVIGLRDLTTGRQTCLYSLWQWQ